MRGLLASPLGFLVGLSLGALGGGGSILAVPVLVYAAGQGPKAATATSLLLVGTAALVGMGDHWRAGRVRVGTGVVFGLTGIGGSLAGSALNHRVDPDLLLLGFAGLVCLAAWRMLTGCPTCTKVGESAELRGGRSAAPGATATLVRRSVDARMVLTVLAAGSAVGFLTGLFGVGGGFVIVPALALGLKLPMPQAIGTSLLVIAINSAVALSARIATTSIEWEVTVPFTIAAVAGVLTGGRVADRIDAQRSLRWFAGLLVVVALYTGGQAIADLLA
ncbi:MAG: sulfite exporter TauE/SafE family protein [Acidimicrobiales bacterium]|nr:sulfite exporter TauE/SafE family protein [Acidimicrobiales bacterium]